MPHGGKRPRAGRKPSAEIKAMRTLFDQVIHPQEWRSLLVALYGRAIEGDLRAARLLLSLRFGIPFERLLKDQSILNQSLAANCDAAINALARDLEREQTPQDD
jgi:hypothetical protein